MEPFFLKLVLCLQQEIVSKFMETEGKFHNEEENLAKLRKKIENLQVSFMNSGNDNGYYDRREFSNSKGSGSVETYV